MRGTPSRTRLVAVVAIGAAAAGAAAGRHFGGHDAPTGGAAITPVASPAPRKAIPRLPRPTGLVAGTTPAAAPTPQASHSTATPVTAPTATPTVVHVHSGP